ncbi:MAG: hypothetical protein FWC70_08050 [Defluviitaleaceae bacterium]|nr:hypothetical protein [Defluviitaleaceae bacterium]
MYRDSFEGKMKNLAVLAAGLVALATAMTLLVLFVASGLSLVQLVAGVSCAVVFSLLCYLVMRTSAGNQAVETKGDASNLAKAASAMAVGDFSPLFRTDISDELGQIELALSQLAQVQKAIIRDIDAISRSGTLIDENNYSGEFRETARKINAMVAAHADADAAVLESLKSIESGDAKGRVSLGRTETAAVIEELRKKTELLVREHQSALSAAESAKKEAESSREDAAAARREAVAAQDDAVTARREASSAATDAANARREAAAAERRAERLRPPVVAGATKPIIQRTAPVSNVPRLAFRDAATPALKSTKITVPSGAHEYERKDYGKY